jgi:hypothetical protein
MKIEPFTPINTLIKAVKVSPTYVEQGDVLVTRDSLLQGLGLESGTFTPVVSNESNIVNVVVDGGLYSRVGDIVTMSFRLSFELDAPANNGTFNFSLPIATTFTTRYQLMGIAKFNNSTASDNTNYVVEADNSFVTLGIASISSSAAADTFQDCEMMVQYQIL